jgi:hypothetical protein
MSAAADPVVVSNTIDATTITLSLLNTLVFPAVLAVCVALVGRYVKNKDAATIIDKAITNSAGYAEATIGQAITTVHPSVELGLSPYLQTRLQYVLDHAGPEIDRLYKSTVDPEIQKLLAQKVVRQQGLEQLAVNPTAVPLTPGGAAPILSMPVTAVGDPPTSNIPPTRSTRNSAPP